MGQKAVEWCTCSSDSNKVGATVIVAVEKERKEVLGACALRIGLQLGRQNRSMGTLNLLPR